LFGKLLKDIRSPFSIFWQRRCYVEKFKAINWHSSKFYGYKIYTIQSIFSKRVLCMEYLFGSKDGYQFFKEKKEGITAEIDTLSKTELDSNNDSLKIILKAKHTLRLIEFAEPCRVDKGEIQINISNDPRFAAYLFRDDDEGPVYKKGRQIEVHLPFSCDKELFEVHPSTFTTVLPKAENRGTELVFTCDFFSDVDTPEQVKKKELMKKSNLSKCILLGSISAKARPNLASAQRIFS
jgi:hypothetical protein